MLLGGPHATAFAEFAAPLGFTGLEPYADTIGLAAATKLCRSVMIKGIEALLTESMPKPDEYYHGIVEWIARLGWHVVIYFEAADLAERWDFFTALPPNATNATLGAPWPGGRTRR